jgi:DnaJ-class molecular chaperone
MGDRNLKNNKQHIAMSNNKHYIQIEPPSAGSLVEGLYSPGHVCKYCNGVGYFTGDSRPGGAEEKVCPVCEGKGELDAMVTIEWKPTIKA